MGIIALAVITFTAYKVVKLCYFLIIPYQELRCFRITL
jgi:hypothetical protein